MIRHDNFAAQQHVVSPSLLLNYDLPFVLNNNCLKLKMSSAYQTIIMCLCEQMQTIPAPPAEQSNYEVWARSFLKTLVHCHFVLLFQCLLIIQAAFDHLAKGGTDAVVEEMMNEAIRTIGVIMNDTWMTWAS